MTWLIVGMLVVAVVISAELWFIAVQVNWIAEAAHKTMQRQVERSEQDAKHWGQARELVIALIAALKGEGRDNAETS